LITGATFTTNIATNGGGGVFAWHNTTTITVSDSTFTSNTADLGGAMQYYDAAIIEGTANTYTTNTGTTYGADMTHY
jgi:hypothetical protein